MSNIGVFDSGVGGLSVLRELINKKKGNYYYLGDTKRVPYGGRDKTEIIKLADEIVNFLEKYDIDEYVIACNTMSVIAIDYLREKYKKKFYSITKAGIDEANKYSGDFLVLATKATVDTHQYKINIEKNTHAKVYEIAAHNLVSLIENGLTEGNELDNSLRDYLKIANDEKIPNIILGCTHYPFIKDSIIKNLNYKANIIDPSNGLMDLIKLEKMDKNSIHINMTEESPTTKFLIESLIREDYELVFEEI